jgi:hypothetical protein
MPRKPTDVAQFKLRIRENLRRQLEKAAVRNQTSINVEIVNRLRASFEAENIRALDEIVADLDIIRQGFATLWGADKLTADPQALDQTIALLGALRDRVVSPLSSETQKLKPVILMDRLSDAVHEAYQRAETETPKHERKKV